MGKRGPARTPTNILKMRGSWRAKGREGEPRPDASAPRCPKWLRPEAKRVWRELVPQLERMNVLARCDRNAIARYCQVFAKWRSAEEFLKEHGEVYPEKNASGQTLGLREYPQVSQAIRFSEQLLRLEREFGLTPSARANLSVGKKPPEGGGKARFFKKLDNRGGQP